jgi:hypothetical protein
MFAPDRLKRNLKSFPHYKLLAPLSANMPHREAGFPEYAAERQFNGNR